MAYTYGMRGAPAVGGGVPGLPQSGSSAARVGDIRFFAANPGGDWLPADGSIVSQSTYPELYSAIGLLPSDRTTEASASAGSANDKNDLDINGLVVIESYNGSTTSFVRRSTNGGTSYTSIAALNGNGGANYVRYFGNNVWLAAIYVGVSDYQVFRSTDNGVSWTSVETRSSAHRTIGVNKATGVAMTAISRSVDSGATWSAMSNYGVGSTAIQSVASNQMPSGSDAWYIAGSNGFIAKSTDSGANWTTLTYGSTSTIESVAAFGDIVVTANLTTTLRVSYDGGLTWQNVASITGGYNCVRCNDAGVFVAASERSSDIHTIISSSDAISWGTVAAVNVGAAVGSIRSVLCSGNGDVYAVGSEFMTVSAKLNYKYNTSTQFALPSYAKGGLVGENIKSTSTRYYIKAR